jgi:hypothetical protein
MNEPVLQYRDYRKISAALKALWMSAALVSSLVLPQQAIAKDPDKDAADIAARAARNSERAAEQAQRIDTRAAEDMAKIRELAIKDPAKAVEEQAKLDADTAKERAKAQEDADKQAADIVERNDKLSEDIAKDAADAAEDNAREAGDAADSMHELGESENPDYDKRGYAARRGEIVALDLSARGLESAKAQGFTVIEQTRLPSLESDVFRLGLPTGMDADNALKAMVVIDPNGTYDRTHYYGLQFAAAGARDSGGSKATLARKAGNLTIGMIDTGVTAHPALKGVEVKSRDFSNGTGAVSLEHGTAIASLLASEGGSKLYVANIFRGSSAKPFTSADALVGAMEWMVAQNVNVINISLSGPRNAILDKLIHRAAAKGYMIVAAAGNGGPTASPAYPAAIADVIAVTAVDGQSRIYRYANQGHYITVAAPGVSVPAADAGGGIARYSGTSFAAPHIAAWMARCLSKLGSGAAGACSAKMTKSAKDLGAPGRDPVYGYGLID